jgi:hypothetical protein
VNLNLPNNNGETPLDIAQHMLPKHGLYPSYVNNSSGHYNLKHGRTTRICASHQLVFRFVLFCRVVKQTYPEHSKCLVL